MPGGAKIGSKSLKKFQDLSFLKILVVSFLSGSRILRFSDVPGPQSYPMIGTLAAKMWNSKFSGCAFINVSLSLIGEKLLQKKSSQQETH